MLKEKIERELIEPPRKYLGQEWYNLIKTKVSSNGAYIQYESDGDTYFKALD